MKYWFNEIVDSAIAAIYYDFNIEKAQEAMQKLETAANNNDADAMYLLARCYGGKDFCSVYYEFPEDALKMKKYMEKSIINGSALGVIGSMRSGMLSEQMKKEMPFSSLLEAWEQVYAKAEAGCAFCQNMVGNAYYWLDILDITETNESNFENQELWFNHLHKMVKQSIFWYEKAFQNGMSFSGRNLVNLYENGGAYELCSPDVNKAIAIEKLGAELGYPEWKEKYGTRLIETGKDERRGVQLCEEAALQGYKIGWFEVAMAYQRGNAFPIDYKKSLEAAENGIGWINDYNCCELAIRLYMGNYYGITQNYKRAFQLLKRLESQGNEWGFDRLAFCYAHGYGCSQDSHKALDLLEYLWENEEDTYYMDYTYAFLLANGLGVEQDIQKAAKIWHSIRKDFPLAEEALQGYKRTLFGKWIKK